MVDKLRWLGHSSFKIIGEKIIVIDPYQIEEGISADIILITHNHYDHLSPEDLRKIRGEHTQIVIPASSAGGLSGNVKTVEPGDLLNLEGIEIQVVPSYNIDKRFHPKEKNYVGYVVTVDGVSYYHAGDTDLIPEMKDIKADVALLPVGGTYTMDAEEAARAAKDIQPRVAIPMHWGSIIGGRKDAERFRDLCDCDVVILEKGE